MSLPESRMEHGQISDEQRFHDLLGDVRNRQQELSQQSPHADNLPEAVADTMDRLGQNPDSLFSLVTKHTKVFPSELREIVGGGSSWNTWNSFKRNIITAVIRHEFQNQDRDKQTTSSS